jgi:predicted peptidase
MGRSGGSAGGGGTDGGVASDGGKSDAARDAIVGDGPSQARQTARPIGMPYSKNGFWEYLPPGYGDGTPRPLLVFWHGVGEDGAGTTADLPKVLVHGPPKLINLNQWPATRPFVVLSPQHPGSGTCPTVMEIHDFLTFAIGAYAVDPARVYLTGLSCGALGSWSYLGQYLGQQVVAAVLIAGNSSLAYDAMNAGCNVVNQVALWSFHGDADQSVPIAADTMGMNNFMACPMPRKDAKYTIYPGVDHEGSWTRTYDLSSGNDIYAWMLMQHR